ncbi:nucleoporin protein Ndc1-Nup [Geopyxis carbonaria]|nr:nucleoporin protein Ndc1-Nup [Geopyxis carbonaria]
MVYSIAGSLPAAVPRREPVHYHSYLTPLLHRRFARSCAITIIACYVESFLIGNKSNIFWACFPLSWTGVRCLCLFLLGSFPVLILRISQLHLVDTRAYASAFHGVRRLLGSFSTYTAVCVYVISSMTVTLSYLYSSGDDAQLHMITEARSYERPRLNERFLYILFLALYTGMIQGINHIREDKGRVVLSSSSLSPQEAIKLHYLDALKHMSSSTMVACLSGPIVYLPLRPLIWENALILARTFYWLNRSTVLPNFPIGPGLFFRSVLITFLTCGLVEVSHLAFASHFSYDHLSAGKCLIEKSSDPNGTLLTGLRSTKSPLTRVSTIKMTKNSKS